MALRTLTFGCVMLWPKTFVWLPPPKMDEPAGLLPKSDMAAVRLYVPAQCLCGQTTLSIGSAPEFVKLVEDGCNYQ